MPKILIVDDVPTNIKILLDTLANLDYEILVATNGATALQIAQSEILDLILLDIMMPEMDGYEVCTKLKENAATKNIPVIFITARDAQENEAKGLELGAVDYITKPISRPIVQTRVKNHLKLEQTYKELEKKNVALEEVAILREHVERITRHDLKTPLNGIICFSRMFIDRWKLNPEQREILTDIEQAGYRMLNMINCSLDLYKMETGTYQYQANVIDLLRIFQKVVDETKSQAKREGLSVDIMLFGKSAKENDTFFVQGEVLLCHSMLANLLKNALEAAPKGTHITVFLEDEKDNALISIHNQGAVPKEIRAKFFDKYTTAGKFGGTGLGTYSAKLMAETHGGSIHLETSEETGTTVTVRLLKRIPPK
jgi:CheY-like chemotaxis protein